MRSHSAGHVVRPKSSASSGKHTARRDYVAGSHNKVTWTSPTKPRVSRDNFHENMLWTTTANKHAVSRDHLFGTDTKMKWTSPVKQMSSSSDRAINSDKKAVLTSPSKQVSSREHAVSSEAPMMTLRTSSIRQMLSRSGSMPDSGKTVMLPQLPVLLGSEVPSVSPASNGRLKSGTATPTAQSPVCNSHRKAATTTPTGMGQSPARMGQSPASIARNMKLAATTPTRPKRNLRSLTKENLSQSAPAQTNEPHPMMSSQWAKQESAARPWTVDPAMPKTPDVGTLKKKLFEAVDCDHDNEIHFSEFLELHRNLMTCDSLVNKIACDHGHETKAQYLEKEFRKWDRDGNLGINEFEWEEYISAVLDVVGKNALIEILENLLNKRKSKITRQGTISKQTISERLLEKSIHIDFLGKSHADQASILLKKGADPNTMDDNGESVVNHFAAKCEPAFMAKLLESGGNAALNSNDFDCPVLVAARARRLEVLRVLVFQRNAIPEVPPEQAEQDLSSKLVLDIHELTEKQIRELVHNGADINFRNTQGWTPLTSAVFWGRRDAVETLIRLPITNPRLLRLKADIPNLKGRTALHVAARKGKVELIPLLVGARADVNARDMDGWTPLHHAVFNSRSEVVHVLHSHGAKLTFRSHRGITPFMLASSSDRVAVPMTQDALELLQPPDCVRFKEVILPILKNQSLLPYEKVNALMDLPGVFGEFENLRLYDQVFRLNRGPNKVQLKKLWDLLCHELLMRLRSGEVDLEPAAPHCSDIEMLAIKHETQHRQEKQQQFITSWLTESAGPPASPEWIWDNREGYREELTECIRAEIQGFCAHCGTIQEQLANEFGGLDLLDIPRDEILHQQYLTQLGAHPILDWIDCADVISAFNALCDVKTFGDSGDDNEVLTRFMELVSTDSDFMTGPSFWQNVYKLWLSNFACLSRPSFHHRLQKFVEDFNFKNEADGFEVSISEFHAKTFQELKACESKLGTPGYKTHDERTVASKALNAISCRIIANSPATVAQLVYSFRQCSLSDEKIELVRIQNGFHKDAVSQDGLREVTLNIIFKGGSCHGHGAREGRSMSVMLVGEVQIVLPQIDSAWNGMKLLSEFVDGNLDPKL